MTARLKALRQWRDNGEVIEACAQLGYLKPEWEVFDATYGEGTFWSRWRPDGLHINDLNPERLPRKGRGLREWNLDATDLSVLDDRVFDAVVWDPPYRLCLDYETEILTRRGWLRYNEVQAGDDAWSLDHDTGKAGWRRISAVSIFDPEWIEVCVTRGKSVSFVATPDHSWPVISGKGNRRWVTTETMASGDQVLRAAPSDRPTDRTYSDAFVELVAWWWTEGDYSMFPRRGSHYGRITQSPTANLSHCDRIARCLTENFGPAVEKFPRRGGVSTPMWRWEDDADGEHRRFIYSAAVGRALWEVAPAGVADRGFLDSLTQSQLDLFIEVSILADGSTGTQTKLGQRCPERADRFALACILAGRPVSFTWDKANDNMAIVSVLRATHVKPRKPGITRMSLHVGVWCPTVEGTGSWFARRDGKTYFTGNTGTPDTLLAERYGVEGKVPWQKRMEILLDGAEECARIAKRVLLVKCQDQVVSGAVRWQTMEVTDRLKAMEPSLFLTDMVLVPNTGRAQPQGRSQVHFDRNYSTLLVFKRRGRIK